MTKINKISSQGNNNIIIQDVNGCHVYINSDEGVKQFIVDYKEQLAEIRKHLVLSNDIILREFGDKIYNIAHITNANFYGGNHTIKVENFQNIGNKNIDKLSILNSIEERFNDKLNKRMNTELRFQLELNLQYTREETNQTFLNDYYVSHGEKQIQNFRNLFSDYENILKRLLILGEAGSGKTLLLLKFGLFLIEKSKQDIDFPIPIFLNLATWNNSNEKFDNWLVDNLIFALGEKSISKHNAEKLIKNNNLLLLLDGLDELTSTNAKSCLEKLDTYLDKLDSSRPSEKNFPTVILSCRKNDYIELSKPAPVRATIYIAQLTEQKVKAELERIKQSGDIKSQILLNRIAQYPQILERFTNAFELHIALSMAKTFDFSNTTTERLVDEYINQELQELEKIEPNTQKYLSFLAQKVNKTGKGVSFEMSNISEDWLDGTPFEGGYKLMLWIFSTISALYVAINLLFQVSTLHATKEGFVEFLSIEAASLVRVMVCYVFFLLYTLVNKKQNKLHLLLGLVLYLSITIHAPLGYLSISIIVWISAYTLATDKIEKYKKPLLNFKDYVTREIYYLFIFNLFASFSIAWHMFIVSQRPNTIQTYLAFFINSFLLFNIASVFLNSLLWLFIRILFLYMGGFLPLFLMKFLNKAAKTGIIEKDGVQWVFRHYLFQERLAKSNK